MYVYDKPEPLVLPIISYPKITIIIFYSQPITYYTYIIL